MSSFTPTAILSLSTGGVGAQKRAVIQCTGPSSYDTNGSVLNLSSSNSALVALDPMAPFKRVDGVSLVAVGPHGSDKYRPAYVRDTDGAPATGTVKVRDLTASSDAEVTSTADLSATTFTFEVLGQ